MSGLFLMMALWFVLGARRRHHWALRRARHARLRGAYGPSPPPLDPWEPGAWGPPRMHHRVRPPEPRESRFEVLKRRFVSGDLTDEEYERELDLLLGRPGGMKEIGG